MERKWNENIENWENTKVILWTTFKKKSKRAGSKRVEHPGLSSEEVAQIK